MGFVYFTCLFFSTKGYHPNVEISLGKDFEMNRWDLYFLYFFFLGSGYSADRIASFA